MTPLLLRKLHTKPILEDDCGSHHTSLLDIAISVFLLHNEIPEPLNIGPVIGMHRYGCDIAPHSYSPALRPPPRLTLRIELSPDTTNYQVSLPFDNASIRTP